MCITALILFISTTVLAGNYMSESDIAATNSGNGAGKKVYWLQSDCVSASSEVCYDTTGKPADTHAVVGDKLVLDSALQSAKDTKTASDAASRQALVDELKDVASANSVATLRAKVEKIVEYLGIE